MYKSLLAITIICCLTLAAAAIIAGPAVAHAPGGCGTFADHVTYPGGGGSSRSVAMGDLDGDLDIDLVKANRFLSNVSVLLNNGDGTFAAQVTFDTGDGADAVAIGDLDGDLDLDLVTANGNGANVSVLMNNGDRTFAIPVIYSVSANLAINLAIDDLDGDLDLDLVMTIRNTQVSVRLNNGDGTFAAEVIYSVGSDPVSVAIGDLDGDLDLDLVTANRLSHNISVLLNNGDGTFADRVDYSVGSEPSSVAIGDLDGDLDLDLAIGNHEGAINVTVRLNNGDGTFATPVFYNGGAKVQSIAVGDLDGDLDLDLVTANHEGVGTVSVLLNNGDGTFAAEVPYDVGSFTYSVAIGDLDSDLDLDLVSTSFNNGTVSVLLNECGSTTVVTSESFLITRGTYVSGGVIELAESDNADLSIQRATADTQSRTEFEVKTISLLANPASLEVTLEGAVFARSQVDQTIELFDYVAAAWEQVDTRAATRFTDSTVTVAATGDLSRFLEAGTMCIEARIRYQSIIPRQQFTSNTDQFIWTIRQ